MANECSNQLVVAGIIKDLSEFKKRSCNYESGGEKEIDLDMNKLVPLSDFRGRDREDRAWGCDWVCDAQVEFTDSGEGYGCLEFTFLSAWTPPEMFVKNASVIFPRLEFHLTYFEEGVGFAGSETYVAGKKKNEVLIQWLEAKQCLDEYVARPRPSPWEDGLFEDPDAPKPFQNATAADSAGGKKCG